MVVKFKASRSRQGVIIQCPLNGLFNNARDVILMSRTGVSEMVDNVNDNEPPITAVDNVQTSANVITVTLTSIRDQ